jgi:hypothetical protein
MGHYADNDCMSFPIYDEHLFRFVFVSFFSLNICFPEIVVLALGHVVLKCGS